VTQLATAGVTYPKIDFEDAVASCEQKTGNDSSPKPATGAKDCADQSGSDYYRRPRRR